jgi:hypothetical protein
LLKINPVELGKLLPPPKSLHQKINQHLRRVRQGMHPQAAAADAAAVAGEAVAGGNRPSRKPLLPPPSKDQFRHCRSHR